MVLKHPFHDHPLILRIMSEGCLVECQLCQLVIHGPAYCCEEGCYYFLHGSCALIELPPNIRHPSHRRHPLTLADHGHASYHCSRCIDVSDVHVLTAITTLLPPNDEVEEKYEDDDEDGDDEDEEEDDAEDDDNDDEEEDDEDDYDYYEDEEGEGDENNEEEGDDDYNYQEEEDYDNDEDGDADNKEEGILMHFAHTEHPLASFHVENLLVWPVCGGCERRISGQVYGCRACLFLLHASCVQSPRVINHPFGSQFTLSQLRRKPVGHKPDECGFCSMSISDGLVYSHTDGSSGSFKLHMACALSTKFPQGYSLASSPDFKVHRPHPCPLVFFQIEEETYRPVDCRVCFLKILGEALGCPKCGFFLHKSCAEKLPEVIHHHLHPEHSLKLVHFPKFIEEPKQGDKDYFCASCQGSLLIRGVYMAFQCDTCEFYLHSKCALQTLSAVEAGVVASVSHFAHEHPLQLHFVRGNGCCKACELDIYGLAYGCATCNSFQLHKSCAELPKELEHPFHSQHLLVLVGMTSGTNFHCNVCRTKCEGLGYFCAECEFYLDMGCVSLNLTLKHPRHEHKLAYSEERKNKAVMCNACHKTCTNDLYVCVPCNFRLHYDCLPLRPKIKHEGHVHPVFLQDKFVDGDPNYQYCDHCEELRNPEHGVYRCEECWFSGHIDCMISKDEVEVEKNQTEVVEAEETEGEEEEMETSEKTLLEQLAIFTERKKQLAILKSTRLKPVIDASWRNIDTMTKSLEELVKELESLEMERDGL